MMRRTLFLCAAFCGAGLMGLVASGPLGSSDALAMASNPAPTKIDCRKRKNKKKKECKKKQSDAGGSLSDDQLYQAGYWLARKGKFEEALVQLRKAKNQSDPRILNYIGYTTRKLGRVDEAMGYYRKALEANPDYTMARAYLGEAFLEQGKVDQARAQLVEIEQRCGRTCDAYAVLAGQITSYKASGTFEPQGKVDAKVASSG